MMIIESVNLLKMNIVKNIWMHLTTLKWVLQKQTISVH
jgi:hypothetical protein